MFKILFLMSIIFPTHSQASSFFIAPTAENQFIKLGTAQFNEIKRDEELSFLVWNVEKYKDKETIEHLKEFSKDTKFILLQEHLVGRDYDSIFSQIIDISWLTAVSFYDKKKPHEGTGVSTASYYKEKYSSFDQSEAREPIFGSPKMSVYTEYTIEKSSETLLVVNVHAINFVGQKKFESHIKQIFRRIEWHSGPIFLAGDFNTWRKKRTNLVFEMANSHGLSPVKVKNDKRWLKLDHIFTRGIAVDQSWVVDEVKSSDHFPLYFRGKLKP